VLAPLRQFEDKQLDFLILLSLSGGHPRSLALLKVELERRDQRNVMQVLSDWRRQVQHFVKPAADELVEVLLAKTLLGEDNLRVRLRTLLELGHNLQHRSFEEFHAIFEELRCWAWHKLNKAEDVTLRKWIPKGSFEVASKGLLFQTRN
jgi:hypothetical protein